MDSKEGIVNELYKPARKNYSRRKTIMRGLYETIQADLAEMSSLASENGNFKYILVCIDILSKMSWCRKLKSKTGQEVATAMSSILDQINAHSDHKVRHIHTDMGGEFFSKPFENLMKKHGIIHYATFSGTKAAICERLIRTLKFKLYRSFNVRGNYQWTDILDSVVHIYNTTKHRTTKYAPVDVDGSIAKKLLQTVYKYKNVVNTNDSGDKNKLALNQTVRISKQRKTFHKGYFPIWTTELFNIVKIIDGNPKTYLLRDYQGNDIVGSFYEPELQATKYTDMYLVEKIVKKKNNNVLVKWLGFPSEHNSWVKTADIE